MISRYFATSLRSLLRQKTYLFINLMGLAVGIAAFLVIMLFVTHEWGYDHNIEKREHMFRVVEVQNEPGVGSQHVAITMAPLANSLKTTFPQIKETVRILPAYHIGAVSHGVKNMRESDMYYTDPSIIEMFSIKLLRGNPQTVLIQPNSVVLSKSVAEKYFGTMDKALNSILKLDNESMRVDAIMEDQPETMHLFFDILISMSSIEGTPDFEWMNHWNSNSLVTYILLNDKSSAKEIEEAFPHYIQSVIFSKDEGWDFLEMYLQPVDDIYLKSQHIKFQMSSGNGNSRIVNVFLIIAVLVLLIACVNYINISLARSVKQAREVGMRKVLGADRMSLVYRYISESLIITLIAILLAIGLLELILPELNKVLGTSFEIDFKNPLFNVGLVALLLIISLISGSYPAFYLSRFQPIHVLKGGISAKGSSVYLSKGLMVFQFAISISLIFSILMINDQIKFIQNKDLGINYTNSVFVYLGRDDYKKLKVLKNTLLENPAIKRVSGASYLNGVSGSQGHVYIDDTAGTKLTVRYGYVDEDFFGSMGISLVEGRNFNESIKSDSAAAVILNQSAVTKLGWEHSLGMKLNATPDGDSTIKPVVIGVIQDYHYYSLRSIVEPAAYFYMPEKFRGVIINYSGQVSKETITGYIETKWREIYPRTPFQSIFSEESIAESYKAEYRVRALFVYFAVISLFLSCLGLYGLTSLLIEQKTKNIGIRKVLGSPVYLIVLNLVKEYLFLVGVAGIISVPIAILFVMRFLEDYPYRVDISMFNVFAAVMVAVMIAFVTIVFKAGKTANSNPLEALKYE